MRTNRHRINERIKYTNSSILAATPIKATAAENDNLKTKHVE